VNRDFRIWVKISSPVKYEIWIPAFAGMTIGGASPTLRFYDNWWGKPHPTILRQLVGQAPPYNSKPRISGARSPAEKQVSIHRGQAG
ncbi:MAG: hypothetical protein ABIL62_19710, partial [Planctomycetota bacterium]